MQETPCGEQGQDRHDRKCGRQAAFMARRDLPKPLAKLRTDRQRRLFIQPNGRLVRRSAFTGTAPPVATAIKRFSLHTDYPEVSHRSLLDLRGRLQVAP